MEMNHEFSPFFLGGHVAAVLVTIHVPCKIEMLCLDSR